MLGHEGADEVHLRRDARLRESGPGRYTVEGSDVVLSRINDLNELQTGPKDPCSRQILFRA